MKLFVEIAVGVLVLFMVGFIIALGLIVAASGIPPKRKDVEENP